MTCVDFSINIENGEERLEVLTLDFFARSRIFCEISHFLRDLAFFCDISHFLRDLAFFCDILHSSHFFSHVPRILLSSSSRISRIFSRIFFDLEFRCQEKKNGKKLQNSSIDSYLINFD